jgi:hypothetical protein
MSYFYYKHIVTAQLDKLPEAEQRWCIDMGDGGWLCPDRELETLLRRARKSLYGFAGRYTATQHAEQKAKEARLIIQEIDERLLET